MTPAQFTAARTTLAQADGIGRPYSLREFGLLIGFEGQRPDNEVRRIESGARSPTGAVVNVVLAMLAGWRPPVWYEGVFGKVRAENQ